MIRAETEQEKALREALEDASRKVANAPAWLRSIYDHNRAIEEEIRRRGLK